jgi:protoporphyrinogen oxidase
MEFKLESLIVNESDEMKNFKRRVLQRLLKAETAESGCATMELCSLVEYGSYMVPLHPNIEFPGGFSRLISFLANQVPKERIKLEHAVKYVRKVNGGQELDVECHNGSSFRAKHVIITCSVNYLQKYHKRMFEPLLLDQRKIEAINSVKMGTVDKIFMFYGK